MALAKYKVEALFRALDTNIPDPKSDLQFQNVFELLIAVILSAQSTDVAVNKVTPALFAEAPTAAKMVTLGVERVKEHIKTLGLYNNKAKNLISCCQSLVEKHGGEIPKDRDTLTELAGVGTKTAGVVMNVAFGEACIPVDTHVFRLANRTGLVNTKNPDATEKALLMVVPDWAKAKAHHLLILHGRYVCKARTPDCEACVIQAECKTYPKLQKQAAKKAAAKAKTTTKVNS